MSQEEKKKCPDCKTNLELVSLTDLLENKNRKDLDSSTKILLNNLAFYVCTKCGRTLVYSSTKVRELASEVKDTIIGTA